ncbi:MAG TPA: IclR family transcriptional regulator [Jiangellaceae bacterium]|nr:IclR family transcriptional regulator [Jiangellaceae bacterium]
MTEDSGVGGPFLSGTGRNASLGRAFEVLEAVAATPDGASVAELAKQTGLPRSTVSRVLASLFDVGAAARPGGQRNWVVGPTIARLSRGVQRTSLLAERVRPVLLELTSMFREASMLAVPVGLTTARVLDQVECPRLVGATTWSEPLLSSPASGTVRILLAELEGEMLRSTIEQMNRPQLTPATKTDVGELVREVEEVRALGYSTVVDEIEDGLAGVGVAVRDEAGRVVGLLSVYLPTSRLSEAMERGMIEQLKRSSRHLEQQAVGSE